MYILLFILGFIFGCFCSFFIMLGGINGIINVNDDQKSYFFNLSSDYIHNPKNKFVIFRINHDSQK